MMEIHIAGTAFVDVMDLVPIQTMAQATNLLVVLVKVSVEQHLVTAMIRLNFQSALPCPRLDQTMCNL